MIQEEIKANIHNHHRCIIIQIMQPWGVLLGNIQEDC